jgi:replicative DNA helicase
MSTVINFNSRVPEGVKLLPQSLEAERAVLGGLMLDSKAIDNIVSIVQPEDFYRQEHTLIYNAIIELVANNSPVDVITLSEALKAKKLLERAGGDIYLFEMARNTPSVANIEEYANIVREMAIKRALIIVGQAIANSGFNTEGKNTAELLDQAERMVFALAEQKVKNSAPIAIAQLLRAATDRLQTLSECEGGITGTPTGYTDLDKLTSGLQPADLIIVAGRPSMGKTTFAMNIAEYVAVKGKGAPVLVFSLEMPGSGLAMRLLSSLGRIDQQKLRNGKLNNHDWLCVQSAVNIMDQTPLFVDDQAALTPAEIRARARRAAREHGPLKLIVIDYLQLMRVPGNKENRTAEISEISRSLKALAKELNCPVIALSQLNRSLEQRADKRPVMSDLRESGAIEQDADLIIFIYRDEVYNKDSPDKGAAEIIISKQRNGPIGDLKLAFLGQYNRFENYQWGNNGY